MRNDKIFCAVCEKKTMPDRPVRGVVVRCTRIARVSIAPGSSFGRTVQHYRERIVFCGEDSRLIPELATANNIVLAHGDGAVRGGMAERRPAAIIIIKINMKNEIYIYTRLGATIMD